MSHRGKVFVALMSMLRLVQANSIIGGVDDQSAPYAAFVSPTGVIEAFPNGEGAGKLPVEGDIRSVSINLRGNGLIGGVERDQFTRNQSAYAALILPSGAVKNLPNKQKGSQNLPSDGEINSVAINSQNLGLVVGFDNDTTLERKPYAGFVSPAGILSKLPTGTGSGNLPQRGLLFAAAIDDQGLGLIGGTAGISATGNTGPAIGAFVKPSGEVIPLPHAGGAGNLPSNGEISCVAINSQNIGLVGGVISKIKDQAQYSIPFAAIVTPSGSVRNFPNGIKSDNLPSVGNMNSVSLNNKGAGLIGGIDRNNDSPYAALISSSGKLTNLPNKGGLGNLPSAGEIKSVAINNQGVGLIGGNDLSDGGKPYAALISATGVISNFSTAGGAGNLPKFGGINAVAINDLGIGIIGGYDQGEGASAPSYVGLVSPTGVLTNLSITGGAGSLRNGSIVSVAISNPIMDAVIPTSIGPYDSAIQTLLAASYAYESHLMVQHKRSLDSEIKKQSDISLLCDANEAIPSCVMEEKSKSCSLWMTPFGQLSYESSQGKVPSFSNEIGGVLTGVDYRIHNTVVGGGLGYAFDYVHYSNKQGHAKINQEMALLYASYQPGKIFFNATVWGGLYQLNNERHSLPHITSNGHTHGWLFSPHIELTAIGYQTDRVMAEPFVMFDWINNWQKHFTEQGKAGFNLNIPSLYASLLRSEAGVRLYETARYEWGKILFEQKLSYINQAPFDFSSLDTSFVGSGTTFDIAVGSTRVQNLAGVQLHCAFLPQNEKYPYGSLDFQGQFGPTYQSYFAAVELGQKF